MTNNQTYDLEGAKEVLEALDALDQKELVKIIRSVERKDLNANIIKPLKTAISAYPESLRTAIGIERDKQELAGYRAGIKIGSRSTETPNKPPQGILIRFLDKGTKNRTTKKGYNRGMITGKRAIQSAINNQIDDVVGFFNKDFGAEVDKIISRKLKKINK